MSLKVILRAIRSRLVRVLRCHPVTWLVTAAAAIVVTLLMVPGYAVGEPNWDGGTWWERQSQQVFNETKGALAARRERNGEVFNFERPQLYEHGWLRPWLVRSGEGPFFYQARYSQRQSRPQIVIGRREIACSTHDLYILWSNYDNWPLESYSWRVHPANLAIEGAIALLLVGGSGWLTQRWLRHRGGLFRFRIIDLLGGVTVCGMILGWVTYHTHVGRGEEQVLDYFRAKSSPNAPGHMMYYPYSREWRRTWGYDAYCGPDWLKRVIGTTEYLTLFHHVRRIDMPKTAGNVEDFEQLATLPYVREVYAFRPIPASAIDHLKECSQLGSLHINLKVGSQSEEVELLKHMEEAIGPANLEKLASLGLKDMTLQGPVFLLHDAVVALEGNRQLQKMQLYGVTITPSEVAELQERYPQVAITTNSQATDEDVARMKQLRGGMEHEPLVK